MAIAAAKDVSGIAIAGGTHLTAQDIDLRNGADRSGDITRIDRVDKFSMVNNIINLVAVVVIVAVAAAIHVADGAGLDHYIRGTADGAADITAAEEIGRVVAMLHQDKGVVVVGDTIHTASTVNRARDLGIRNNCCSTCGVFAAQMHQAAYIIIGSIVVARV